MRNYGYNSRKVKAKGGHIKLAIRGFGAQRFYLNLLPVFTPSDRSRRARQTKFRNIGKVISLLKMELSAHRPIFCMHKGSIYTFSRIFIVSLN